MVSDDPAPRPRLHRRIRFLWLVPLAAVVLVAAIAGVALATSGSSGSSRTSSAAGTRRANGSSTAATVTKAASSKHGPTTTTVPPPPPPPPPGDIQPLVTPPLPAEGHWVPAGRQAAWAPGGRPAGTTPVLYTTTLRPGGGAPPTGLAWINTKLTRTVLYAGSGEPSGTWPAEGSIDPSVRGQLVGAFNSGFRLSTGAGGWYTAGKAAVPLQNGRASLAILADGSATVGMWGRDVTLSPDVVSVRQNLHLLVDGGAPVNLSSDWGATLGGGSNVWRSGVGVDAQGDLIYAAGPALDPSGLAHVLAAAGCVRAMELDINPEWVTFSSYTAALFAPPDQVQGTPLLSTMNFGPSHWLEPSSRDFFAVFTR